MEKVSVVIPAYNEENTIKDCVIAVIRSGVFEVVVVNDCSTDSTRTVLDKLSKEYDLTLINNTINEGYRNSLVKGYHHSTADIILFTDADSVVADNAIPQLVKHYEDGADAVFGYVDVKNTEHLHPLVCRIGKKHDKNMRYGGALFSVKRNVLEQIGVFPELGKRGGYDVELMERLREGGYNIVYVDKAKVYSNFPYKIKDVLRRKYWSGKTYIIHTYEHPHSFNWKIVCRGLGFYGAMFLFLTLSVVNIVFLIPLMLSILIFIGYYSSRALEVYKESHKLAFYFLYYVYEFVAGVLRSVGYLSEPMKLYKLLGSKINGG